MLAAMLLLPLNIRETLLAPLVVLGETEQELVDKINSLCTREDGSAIRSQAQIHDYDRESDRNFNNGTTISAFGYSRTYLIVEVEVPVPVGGHKNLAYDCD